MTTSGPTDRLAYDDSATLRDMLSDARLCGVRLRLDSAPPSLRYEDYPREVVKREIEVSEAAQRLANALHLHLD